MFDAVIFDWDGTLADTKKVIVYSFQRVLTEIGCEVSDEFIEKQIGVGPKNILREALKFEDIPFDEKTISKLEEKKIAVQLQLTPSIRLFDGAIDLLNALQGLVKMGLATMSNRRAIEKQLREKDLDKYFDYVISFDEVSKPKPDPEVFLRAASGLGCIPEKCVVLEDSIFGVQAAKSGNMGCVAIPSGSYSAEELARFRPDLIVDSMSEKAKILAFILAKS